MADLAGSGGPPRLLRPRPRPAGPGRVAGEHQAPAQVTVPQVPPPGAGRRGLQPSARAFWQVQGLPAVLEPVEPRPAARARPPRDRAAAGRPARRPLWLRFCRAVRHRPGLGAGGQRPRRTPRSASPRARCCASSTAGSAPSDLAARATYDAADPRAGRARDPGQPARRRPVRAAAATFRDWAERGQRGLDRVAASARASTSSATSTTCGRSGRPRRRGGTTPTGSGRASMADAALDALAAMTRGGRQPRRPRRSSLAVASSAERPRGGCAAASERRPARRAGGGSHHLRDGGTTPWADWAGDGRAAAARCLPGAQQLELLRRLNRGRTASRADLADRVLGASAAGPRPARPASWSARPRSRGLRPARRSTRPTCPPTSCCGSPSALLAEDVAAAGLPSRAGAGRAATVAAALPAASATPSSSTAVRRRRWPRAAGPPGRRAPTGGRPRRPTSAGCWPTSGRPARFDERRRAVGGVGAPAAAARPAARRGSTSRRSADAAGRAGSAPDRVHVVARRRTRCRRLLGVRRRRAGRPPLPGRRRPDLAPPGRGRCSACCVAAPTSAPRAAARSRCGRGWPTPAGPPLGVPGRHRGVGAGPGRSAWRDG